MTRLWRVRTAIVAGCWLALVVLLAALQMDPQPLALAGLSTLVAAVLWLVFDLTDVAAPAAWEAHRDPVQLRRGADTRIRSLHGQLVHGTAMDDGASLHRLLVDITDERLLARHGIDRVAQPLDAAPVLGPALIAFVERPPSAHQLGNRAYLCAILHHIESI